MATTSRSSAKPSSNRHSARSGSEISFTTARTSSAGTPASSHARSTAKPSIASTSTAARAADAGARPDRAHQGVGEHAPGGGEQRAVRRRPGRHERGRERVAVDRLAADHELRLAKAVATCEADVEHTVRAVLGERSRRRRGGLDGADAADERAVRACVEPLELAPGRRDHQHAREPTDPDSAPLRANSVTEPRQKRNAPWCRREGAATLGSSRKSSREESSCSRRWCACSCWW